MKLNKYLIITSVLICLCFCTETQTSKENEALQIGEDSEIAGFWKEIEISNDNLEYYHSPVKEDKYRYLIFGNAPITEPAENLSPDLKVLSGRWEGYYLNTPVKNDLKIILVIQEVTNIFARGLIWSGFNLQYPLSIMKIELRVVEYEDHPAIRFDVNRPDGTLEKFIFSYNVETEKLEGEIQSSFSGSMNTGIELERGNSFYFYKDYDDYLTEKGINIAEYHNKLLFSYGPGYMIYLPPGYEEEQEKEWPFILYLCGTGERGNNLYLMPKIGPLQMVHETEPLPFVIVAPGLLPEFRTFPEEYMDMFLDEILDNYNIDEKRVYVTGLSMGGEAAYRLAMYSPEKITAIAPLSAANPKYSPNMIFEGFKPFEPLFDRLMDIPVWHIHGDRDIIISLGSAQKTVNDFINAGVDVRFTILEDHDHNVWTDTYLNPEIYEWFLQYTKE